LADDWTLAHDRGKTLFGPDKDKEFFFLFDYCQSLEYFSQNPEKSEGGALGESLGNDLLKARLELISEIPKLCSNKVPNYRLSPRQARKGKMRLALLATNGVFGSGPR
jgi:type I site-specific restriction endonuclease